MSRNRSITINTVTAPDFVDGRTAFTPRLHLVVGYDEGGISMMSGRERPRGYFLAVQYDQRSSEGYLQLILDGKGNPTATLELAARFAESKLNKLAAAVQAGKFDAVIDELYAKAVANRSKYQWPESIRPAASV
jgi:hypothetical protein